MVVIQVAVAAVFLVAFVVVVLAVATLLVLLWLLWFLSLAVAFGCQSWLLMLSSFSISLFFRAVVLAGVVFAAAAAVVTH